MAFSVRKAREADLDTLVSFTLAEADEAEGSQKSPELVRQGVQAGIKDPSIATYWVLEEDDSNQVGAVSVIKEWSDWHAGYYWWIQSLFIRPDYRGRNLVGLLMEAVAEQARRENALQVRLYVHRDNARAIKAYRKQGFSETPYLIMQLER